MPDISAANAFLEYLNERFKPLKLTIEFEKEHVLPFVGMQLINRTNKIGTAVYIKPTNTGLLLHNDVRHSTKWRIYGP